MIEKGFVAHAGGRYFRAKENAVIWATVIDSPTFDLLFRECVIVGAELVDAPVVEGIIYVLPCWGYDGSSLLVWCFMGWGAQLCPFVSRSIVSLIARTTKAFVLSPMLAACS